MSEAQPTPARTIAVIDGNSLMHRAFHAIPPTMNAPDGRPTNAIFGFMSMFVKLVDTWRPTGVVCAFDKGKPRVRMEMLPQYKAQRPPMDPLLREQFPMVKELLGAMAVPVAELEGWEGDDILGTLARRGEAEGIDMLLVTGDRDMYQLSSERVRILGTRKGVSDVNVMTPESVADLYGGITPDLVPDFYGLKGDSSDNIPGVPGIGPKKAAALIMQYGSLDEVIAHADEVKGKMGENLRANIDDALVSRKVATIRTDAPIELDLDSVTFPTFDPAQVADAFHALGFTSLTNTVLKLASGEGMDASAPSVSIELVEDPDAARSLLDVAVADGSWLGVAPDEGRSDGTLFGMGHSVWVSCEKGLLRFDDDEADAVVARLLREGHVVTDDAKSLLRVVCPADSSLPAIVDADELDPSRIFDAGIAAYLLDSSKSSWAPGELAEKFLEVAMPEPTDELSQPAIDAVAWRLLMPILRDRLEKDGSARLFDELEMPLVPVLAKMERRGMYVDPGALREQSQELGGEIATMAARIHDAAGEEFNIDSPMQLSHVLFDVLGLPTFGLKKTRRGFYSTNAKVLADLARTEPIVQDVLDYRERAKIKSTYLDALPALIAGDGRVHTTLNQTITATGRLSSSNPNLQNIPVRSELGRRVRLAFTVPEGHVFLGCDYSQIELRLLAHLSGDEHLVAAFREGADFHAATAARTFGIPVDQVTPELRSRAKAVNFGIVYGQQAYGLSTSLKIPFGEAQRMIDRYFEAYPGVRRYLDETVATAHRLGYVETMFGRKRHIPDIHSRNAQMRAFGERTAMNHPMQGSAADIIKIAMVRVEDRLQREGLRSRLILQIHDELDFEVPEDEVEVLSALVREEMEGVVELKVPLVADVSYGATWAEAK